MLTRNRERQFPCERAHSLASALEKSRDMKGDSVWILGGEEIYRQAIPIANRLLLTLVKCRPQGDTFFPDLWRSYVVIIRIFTLHQHMKAALEHLTTFEY